MKNRVIKFRAWDKNGILRFGLLRFHYDTWLINDTIEVPPSLQDPCGDMRYEEWAIDAQTIGQFTGLTDKNGVEIFEGDVVKQFGNPKPFTVEFFNSAWRAHRLYILGTEIKPDSIEVIGNIYQTAHSEIGKDGGR